MHCSNCAKKIARKLYNVSGVVKVQANVAKDYAVVTPQEGVSTFSSGTLGGGRTGEIQAGEVAGAYRRFHQETESVAVNDGLFFVLR